MTYDGSTFPSSDIATFPVSDVARFEEYLNRLPAVPPPLAELASSAPIGHNNGPAFIAATSPSQGSSAAFEAITRQPNPPPVDHEARRANCTREITDFLANRRQRESNYMSRKEIGSAGDRGYLIHRALLDGAAYFARESIASRHGHSVVSVYMASTIFSDNKDGCSTVSAPRMAQLLGIEEKTVRRHQDVLVEHKLLGREKAVASDLTFWPIINVRWPKRPPNLVARCTE